MSDEFSHYTDDLSAQHSLAELGDLQIDDVFKAVIRNVYLWMTLGLLVTAGAALSTIFTPFGVLVFSNIYVFYGMLIGELVLVVSLTAAIKKLTPALAGIFFFLYAALNGVTLSIIFLVYDLGSIATAFFVASALFGAMSLIGYSTKKDLSNWGSYLLMGLIGLIIASVVNIFVGGSGLDWLVSIVGVVLFLALTIYDTQRIKRMTIQSMVIGDEAVAMKMGIIGALNLYLDFINIFLFLLRLLGGRRK